MKTGHLRQSQNFRREEKGKLGKCNDSNKHGGQIVSLLLAQSVELVYYGRPHSYDVTCDTDLRVLARSLAWVGGTSGRTRDPLDRIAALDRSTYRPTCSSERVGTPYRSRKNAIDDAGRYEFCDSSNLQLSLWMDASEQHQGIPTYLPADVLHPPDFSALQSLGPVRSNRECNAMQCNAM